MANNGTNCVLICWQAAFSPYNCECCCQGFNYSLVNDKTRFINNMWLNCCHYCQIGSCSPMINGPTTNEVIIGNLHMRCGWWFMCNQFPLDFLQLGGCVNKHSLILVTYMWGSVVPLTNMENFEFLS